MAWAEKDAQGDSERKHRCLVEKGMLVLVKMQGPVRDTNPSEASSSARAGEVAQAGSCLRIVYEAATERSWAEMATSESSWGDIRER